MCRCALRLLASSCTRCRNRPQGRGSETGQEPERLPPIGRMLFLQLVAEVFDRFADFPAAATKPFLHAAGSLVGHSFTMQPIVVRQIAGGLLQLALDLLALAVEFVAIHSILLEERPCSRHSSYKNRCVSRKPFFEHRRRFHASALPVFGKTLPRVRNRYELAHTGAHRLKWASGFGLWL